MPVFLGRSEKKSKVGQQGGSLWVSWGWSWSSQAPTHICPAVQTHSGAGRFPKQQRNPFKGLSPFQCPKWKPRSWKHLHLEWGLWVRVGEAAIVLAGISGPPWDGFLATIIPGALLVDLWQFSGILLHGLIAGFSWQVSNSGSSLGDRDALVESYNG